MNSAIKVKDLYEVLKGAVRDGLGDKKILISNDDEGNGYHECFFGLSEVKGNIYEENMLPYGVTLKEAEKNYVILG